MTKLATACWLLAASATLVACKKHPAEGDGVSGTVLADTGFRPTKNGYKFENQGGSYPRTPPVLLSAGVAKLFGRDACVGGDVAHCKLTPVATEWMAVVNRAMNIGQCEGMAVSSLAFFQKVHDPATFAPGATSAHDLTHANVGSLIGYYWAFQMLNPVRYAKITSLITQTPNSVEDTLVAMMKRHELATIAIRSDHGGHAVTPYAVVDQGNGIHWIRIYDNNWPDKERHIIIDRNANTWAYELASLNPDVPKEPWAGTAESHSIAVTPLSTRLGKAECPFCAGSKKVVIPHGANGVTLTNGDGQKIGREGDKMVNTIPGAEVLDLNTYVDGAPVSEPMYVVPAEGDYEVAIVGQDKKAASNAPDEDHGVAVIGNGTAVAVETSKLKPNEKDTMSLNHDGGVKYRSGTGGTIPPIRLAADGPGGGMHARISNMKADAHDQLELKMDHKAGQITVQGGGKKAESYDLKVTSVRAGQEDRVDEQKAIKFHAGESHTIETNQGAAVAGGKAAPLKITHAAFVPAKDTASPAKSAPSATAATAKGAPSATTPTAKPKVTPTATPPKQTTPRKH
jgi:hypothetical protein